MPVSEMAKQLGVSRNQFYQYLKVVVTDELKADASFTPIEGTDEIKVTDIGMGTFSVGAPQPKD